LTDRIARQSPKYSINIALVIAQRLQSRLDAPPLRTRHLALDIARLGNFRCC
jgi:hypothetical protein